MNPAFLSIRAINKNKDSTMIIIFSVDDDVLDVLVANHSYTTFPAVFVDKHSNHTCVYGLHLL